MDRWPRVAALKKGRRPDGFHCEYCGALLNVTDPSDPLYLVFDHKIPGEDELAITGAIMNESKLEMTYLEFPVVVHETVSHWDTGRPFRKDVVPFSAWGHGGHAPRATNLRLVEMALAPRRLDAGLLVEARGGKACWICGKYVAGNNVKYCPRCRALLRRWIGEPYSVMAAALKKAYVPELDAFIDYHLGVVLETSNFMSPFYLAFDHLVPGMKGNIVPTSVLANMMKTATDEQEWHAYFRMLDAAMQGGVFERDKLEFRYWRRVA